MRRVAVICLALVSCAEGAVISAPDAAPGSIMDAAAPPNIDAGIAAEEDAGASTLPDAGQVECSTCTEDRGPLTIRFLGVGGFTLDHGADRVLAAPMYSNPSLGSVLTGTIAAVPAVIDRFLGTNADGAQAILVGHAHYDHLMDVPWVWQRTPGATIYGTVDTKRVLAAYAPDRPARCAPAGVDRPQIPRDRVVALNDPVRDVVDYRQCAERQGRCIGAFDGRPGEWVPVPSSHMRVRALCSSHPDQFLFIHFGAGCVNEDQCEAPTKAQDWREGSTLAYLIDFLDPASGQPIFRIYYQDAPTDSPVGTVSPDLLAEKRVDVALLCAGAYDQVTDAPGALIDAMNPRYVIAGHWESLFKNQSEPVEKIPFLDVDEFRRRMEAAMPPGREAPVKVDGTMDVANAWMPFPGTKFELTRE